MKTHSQKRLGDLVFSIIILALSIDVIYLLYSYEGFSTDLVFFAGGCLFCYLCLLAIKFLNHRFVVVDIVCYLIGIGLTFIVNDIYYGDYFQARIIPHSSMKLWPFPFYIAHYTIFITGLLLCAVVGLGLLGMEELKKPQKEEISV